MSAPDTRVYAVLAACLPIIEACIRLRGDQVPVETLASLRADIYAELIKAGQQTQKEAA